AESIDAPVYAAPYCAVLPIDAESRAYAGYLTPSLAGIGERLAAHDVLLFAGGRTLRTTLHSTPRLPHTKISLGADPSVSALDGDFAAAYVVDLRQALSATRMAAAGRPRPHQRPAGAAKSEVAIPERSATALHPTRAVVALLETFPEAMIFDESGLS